MKIAQTRKKKTNQIKVQSRHLRNKRKIEDSDAKMQPVVVLEKLNTSNVERMSMNASPRRGMKRRNSSIREDISPVQMKKYVQEYDLSKPKIVLERVDGSHGSSSEDSPSNSPRKRVKVDTPFSQSRRKLQMSSAKSAKSLRNERIEEHSTRRRTPVKYNSTSEEDQYG